MNGLQHVWAVVLAAGDGRRLAALTTDVDGNPVPKQFCSLNGGGSLLQEALQRAHRIAHQERVCAIVADQHRPYWRLDLWALPAANVIVQPGNRGTAHGVLLSVLSILDRDPLARIVFLPADHYVSDENALAGSLRDAANLLTGNTPRLVLLGVEPDEADPDFGYILPGRMVGDGSYTVQRFVEKPRPSLARELLTSGALWNSFIFAASGTSILGMIRDRFPSSVAAIATALARHDRVRALTEVYEQLDVIDFSSAVMEAVTGSLRVIAAPRCGWTDLGTPKRVADTLRRLDRDTSKAVDHRAAARASAFINLAAQYARLELSR